MAKLKTSDIIDNQLISDFAKLNEQIKILNDQLNNLTKNAGALQSASKSITKTGDGKEVKQLNENTKQLTENTKQLTGVQIERQKVENQIQTTASKIAISNDKRTKDLIALKLRQQESTKATKDQIKLDNTQAGSINKLNAETQKLIKSRANLDLRTKEGQKQFKTLTKEIDGNTKQLKKYDSQIGVSTRNVGNYSSAFAGMPGPLSRVAGGIQMITAAGKAFIATPLGLVIAAISVAVGALTSYFKRSEEGQNSFIKIVKVTGVVLGNLLDIVSNVGKGLFEFGKGLIDFVTGQKSLKDAMKGSADAFNEAGNAIANFGKETKKEIKTAQELADLQAKTDKLERDLIINRAKREAILNELRLKATKDDEFSAKQRLGFLNEISVIQDQMLADELEIAKNRRDIKVEENKLSLSTKEDLLDEANLRATVYQKEADILKQRRKIESERQTTLKEIATEEKKILDEKIKREQEYLDISKEIAEEEIDFKDEQLENDIDRANKLSSELIKIEEERQKKLSDIRKQEEEEIKDKIATYSELTQSVGEIIGQFAADSERDFKGFGKALILTALNFVEKEILLARAAATAKSLASAESIATFGAAGIAKAAIINGLISASFAAIKSQVSQFAKGVIGYKGEGTETSDSNLVAISTGESVITSKGTKKRKNLLHAVNSDLSDAEIFNAMLKDTHEPLNNIVNDDRLLYAMIENNRLTKKLIELQAGEKEYYIPGFKVKKTKYGEIRTKVGKG